MLVISVNAEALPTHFCTRIKRPSGISAIKTYDRSHIVCEDDINVKTGCDQAPLD